MTAHHRQRASQSLFNELTGIEPTIGFWTDPGWQDALPDNVVMVCQIVGRRFRAAREVCLSAP